MIAGSQPFQFGAKVQRFGNQLCLFREGMTFWVNTVIQVSRD
jgi:hypothetical protein